MAESLGTTNQTGGEYQLGPKIARGGMAEIFIALKRSPGVAPQLCVVKKILSHYAAEPEYIEMFRAEAHLSQRLVHPNIVRIEDFKKIDQSYSIVMEYADGFDARSMLAELEKTSSRMTIPMAVSIAMQAARGLFYAHNLLDERSGKNLGIVHRDVSPQNIIIDSSGISRVIDFGIAKFDNFDRETKPGVVKGKFSYMSPEQASGFSVDARSDVFSLCVVLWEMLGMKRLFSDDIEVKTIQNVSRCEITKDLRELNHEVDQDLYQIVMAGLVKDPTKRIQTAGDLSLLLADYMQRHFPNYKEAELGNYLKEVFGQRYIERQNQVASLQQSQPAFSEAVHTSIALSPSGRAAFSKVARNLQVKSQPQTGLNGAIDWFNRLFFPAQQRSPLRIQSNRPTSNQVGFRPSGQRLENINPAKDSTKVFLLLGFLLFLAVTAVLYFNKSSLKYFPLILKTSPSKVIVTVNGRVQNSGNYMNTPVKIVLPIGKHQIGFFHHNYFEKSLSIVQNDAKPLSLSSIDLNAHPKTDLMAVQFSIQDRAQVMIDLDKGLLIRKAPFTFKEGLSTRGYHTITTYPNYPDRRGSFECSFRPKARVTIHVGAKTCQ